MGVGRFARSVGSIVVLAVVLAGCSRGDGSVFEPPVPDLVIEGTGEPYSESFDGTEYFGEFGPLLWGLVTTINDTDEIDHAADHSWVVWGDLWAGQLPIYAGPDIYGITDLAVFDPAGLAAVIPRGTTLIFRQVSWSLDKLTMWKLQLSDGMPDNGICHVAFGAAINQLTVFASSSEVDLRGVPQDAVVIDIVPDCSGFTTQPASS